MEVTCAVLDAEGSERPYDLTRPLSLQTLDLEPPRHGELLVRITTAGVCHSDLSVINGSRPRPTPMALGHEATGIVEDVGAGVEDVRIGDHVVLTFLPRCGVCRACMTQGKLPCEPGTAANTTGELLNGGRRLSRGGTPVNHHLGVSAFATRAVVDRRSAVVIESDIPSDVAALLGCAMLTGSGAVRNSARLEAGQSVAVVGLGGVGLAAMITARALGAARVIAVDSSPEKLRIAGDLADVVLSPEAARRLPHRPEVVIEAAGHPKAFETAVELTAPGGKTVTIGLPHPSARSSISPSALTAEARTIIGSYMGSSVPERDIPPLIALWRAGRLPIERLISGHLPLADINTAMENLASGTALRQMIHP